MNKIYWAKQDHICLFVVFSATKSLLYVLESHVMLNFSGFLVYTEKVIEPNVEIL